MRARRAERCLQRASAALETGSIVEADAALAEARELDPAHSGLRELSDRLEALKRPRLVLRRVQRGWPGVAAAFGLILAGVGGWEVWKYREQIWTYESHLTPSIGRMQPDVDKSSGLAAAGTTAVPAVVPAPAAGPSTDAIVNTQIIRPDLIVTAPPPPPISTASLIEPTLSTPPMTATTGRNVGTAPNAGDTGSNALNPPPRGPETNSSQPPRDVVAPSLSYAAPSTLPSTTSTPIPSFVPPATPPATDATARSSAAGAHTAVDPSPSAAPTAATPSPAPSTAREQSTAVRAALGKYESAYSHLDVAAVRSVWPSIDQRALARAFDSLTAQTVSLQNCTIDVIGATARANCSGRASWTPKIGGGEQTANRKWTFNLNQANGEWHIVQVQAK